MLGAVAVTAKNLEIGRVIRASFGERNDVVYLQLFRRAACHALPFRAIKKSKNVVNSDVAAILGAAAVAGCVNSLISGVSLWILGDPVGYNLLHALLVLVAPAFLVLSVALWVVFAPLLGSLTRLSGELRVSVAALVLDDRTKSRAFDAAASYSSRGHMPLRAGEAREVGFEAELYGLRSRDDFHRGEHTR